MSKRILVVDDEPDILKVVVFRLKKMGYEILMAVNGEEALALMQPKRFHMVFLDAKLPDIDGLDLAKQLRKIDPAIHIVMISGYFYRYDEDVQKAIAKGLVCGFIGKPFNHDEILKALSQDS